MISDFNRRITVLKFNLAKDQLGGNIKTLINNYDLWADVENTSGNKALDNLQVSYSKTFKVTVRYEPSRLLTENDEFVYRNNYLIIQSITKKEEGRVNLLEIQTYNTNYMDTIPSVAQISVGWKPVIFTTSELHDFAYQSTFYMNHNDDIVANFFGAPKESFLALRYPKTEDDKNNWYNTIYNYGYIPDQVFERFEDDDYKYIFSRVDPALDVNNKTIIFSS